MIHFSVPCPSIALPGTESFHLDATIMLLLQAGKQNATGLPSLATAIPHLQTLRSWVFAVQGYSVGQGGPDLTNVVGLSVR